MISILKMNKLDSILNSIQDVWTRVLTRGEAYVFAAMLFTLTSCVDDSPPMVIPAQTQIPGIACHWMIPALEELDNSPSDSDPAYGSYKGHLFLFPEMLGEATAKIDRDPNLPGSGCVTTVIIPYTNGSCGVPWINERAISKHRVVVFETLPGRKVDAHFDIFDVEYPKCH